MTELKQNPTLKDFQEHIAEFCKERGWDTNTYTQEFFLMCEEMGELAKAMRKASGFQHEEAKAHQRFELEEEFADVLNYLLNLANLFNVDLEQAYRAKFEYNKSRVWK